MAKIIVAVLVVLIAGVSVSAQDKSPYQKKQFALNGDTLPYRVLYPQDYDTNKKYPLVLFLHGSAERGKDNDEQGSTTILNKEGSSGQCAAVCVRVLP